MKKVISKKSEPSMLTLKKPYCIILKNAGQRTAGVAGLFSEGPVSTKTNYPR